MVRKEFSAERMRRLRQDGSVNGRGSGPLSDEVSARLDRLEQKIAELPSAIGDMVAAPEPPGHAAERAIERPVEAPLGISSSDDRVVQTLREIGSITHALPGEEDRLTAAVRELDAIVHTTEAATNDILASAEKIEQLAEDIGATSSDPVVAEQLSQISDALARILEASTFQDITGQRISKVMSILNFVEQRATAVVAVWGTENVPDQEVADAGDADDEASLLNGPQLDEAGGMSQDEIDALFD